ncbi:WXG100 family type VII secretion target [Nocardia cyriacigeorgica]|uniref:WXG100 family type VII secretion target n=1 Tax=Nocardia cyriacigeorgica TaxID=135487 RepID=UPI00351523F8
MTGEYTVDLNELENITSRVRGYQAFLTDGLAELETRIEGLKSSWSGVAANAFADAHRDWSAAVADMAEGLRALETTAVRAHTSYSAVSATNLKMVGRRR